MKINKIIFTILAFTAFFPLHLANASDEQTQHVTLPPKSKFQIYLLMGQSNMAGRAPIEPQDRQTHPRVFNFINGHWEIAKEPITQDSEALGPGQAFGKAMAEFDPKVTIGLVAVAVGATPLSRWEKGGDLYQKALATAGEAGKDGVIKGVLWHQGESDAGDASSAKTYGSRLRKMIADFRRDLKNSKIPIVVGELGEFTLGQPKTPYSQEINKSLINLAKIEKAVRIVSSKGLTDRGDHLHFNSQSQRELGKRYAQEMQLLLKKRH